MRELRFRGISLDTNEWVYGYGVVQNIEHNEARIINSTGGNMMHNWDVKPETVGQFIGLNDNNGFDVYEGDILNVNYSGHLMKEAVVFSTGGFKKSYLGDENENHALPFTSLSSKNVEVIGNIHQHPHLLQETPSC